MDRSRHIRILGGLPLAAALAALGGCPGQAAPPAIVLPTVTGGPVLVFDDLAVVLAAVVDEDGRIDPTALAVHRLRLDRQLARLAHPWPDKTGTGLTDERLACLYNARMAWSLRIVARELRPAGRRGDLFELPPTIPQRRLLDTSFALGGREMSLRAIDRMLADYDDYRIAAAAPGATDLAGALPAEPFAATTVRETLPRRFNAYVLAGDRLQADHDRRQLRVPPALWPFRDRIIGRYTRRFGLAEVYLSTALAVDLEPRGRDRMEDARGYPAVRRDGPAGIVATASADGWRR